jgi:hypothetical protein
VIARDHDRSFAGHRRVHCGFGTNRLDIAMQHNYISLFDYKYRHYGFTVSICEQ